MKDPDPETPLDKTPTADDSAKSTPEVEPIVGGSRREQLQSRIVVALIVVGVLSALFWPRGDGTWQPPWGTLETADGAAIEMEPLATPVTLVHFWATWCVPCLDEVPEILRLNGDRDELSVLMVATGDGTQDVLEFMAERAPGATTYFDPKWEVTKDWNTSKLPETHLVVDGRVVHTFEGATAWDDGSIRRKIASEIAAARTPVDS